MTTAFTENTGYQATVVITTKNRKDDLRTSLHSVVRQVPPVEIIVIDDASTDGTADMVAAEFPMAKVFRYETSLGLIVQRNNAADLASTNIIFSLDDDAEFSTADTVAQTLLEFDNPDIGAVSIPMIDTYRNLSYGLDLPSATGLFVDHSFIGTAHALRVDVFKELRGYREFLYHQGEENDYCLRLLNAGYFVRCGRADHIYHHVSPARNLSKIAFYGARNSILCTWWNVPCPYFPIHLMGTSLVNLVSGFKNGQLPATVRGLLRGYLDSIKCSMQRRPVSVQSYKLTRTMRRKGVVAMNQAKQLLGYF